MFSRTNRTILCTPVLAVQYGNVASAVRSVLRSSLKLEIKTQTKPRQYTPSQPKLYYS